MKKTLKNRFISATIVLSLLLVFMPSMKLEAATYTGQEMMQTLIGTRVGRYQLNYTGNTNHYTLWNQDGTINTCTIYNDLGGNYANSSVATLNPTTGTSKIKYAYLVWQTRAKQGATSSIGFITPGGQKRFVSPAYAINDWRVDTVNYSWAQKSLFCMAADVTEIVQNAGYGNYAVCNIPYHNWGDYGDDGGGESPGSWQLIVVEEDDSFPVRAVKLDMGAKFYMSTDFGSQLELGRGLKSKSAGTATGQVFFGASNSARSAPMTENVLTYTDGGGLLGQVVSNTTYTSGLYRNGTLVNGRDYQNGCIRMDLSDINSNMGNNANRINLTVENDAWTTSFFLGMSVDIAYPEFAGTQSTVVNSAKDVTVTGTFENTASTANTGIYDGRLVVNLDSGLVPEQATAVVNGTSSIVGTISGNTVTFSGTEVASMMNGSKITYTVKCSTNHSGKTLFQNDAGFHGYLRSDGTNTGYWIEKMWTASSSAVPKYSVTIEQGDGIESVSGGGDYTYGSSVSAGVVVKPGHHWMGWTGSYNASNRDYSFTMPNHNVTLRANTEANSYTIVFHPNDGVEQSHINEITVKYDETISLPGITTDAGTDAYVKYTLDGVNITEQVVSGAIVLDAQGRLVQEEAEEAVAEQVETAEEVTAEQAETAVAEQAEVAEMAEEAVAEQTETAEEEPQPDKKAYASVFMGWSLEAGKTDFEPQWEPETELKVSDIVDAAGMTNQNGAVITLYAVWDDCPWIQATHLYYTLEQAQSGFITDTEILSHMTAYDREDGSPIEAGFHEDGTSFSIPDYAPTDFTQFQHEGSCTENLTVVDSAGSVYAKQITVYVVDTTPVAVKPEGTTRFINEYYYNQPYELGGLADDSIWKTDPEYVAAIQEAFDNLRNDTPQEVYHFTHEQILEMKEFVSEHGIGNSKELDALQNFYDLFMAPNRVE